MNQQLMNQEILNPIQSRRRRAFSLVELLVVIAVIGILAAMIFPAVKGIKNSAARKKAKAELAQIEAAIEQYKAQYSHYPPDNPANTALNQLFYELQGTKFDGVNYTMLDGRTNISAAIVSTTFGTGGFVNTTKAAGADDFGAAKNCLPKLIPGQYGFLTTGVGLLTTSVPWPQNLGPAMPNAPLDFNPVNYRLTNPQHNLKTYDLWVDIIISGKTNRISNWNPTGYDIVN